MVFVGEAGRVDLVEDGADHGVRLEHAVGVFGQRGQPRLAAVLRADVGAKMHSHRVHLDEERLVRLHLPVDEVDRGRRRLVVDRLHPLSGQRPGVLDGTVG